MAHQHVREKIAALAALRGGLHRKDFLLTWQQGDDALRTVLLGAEVLRDLVRAGTSTRVFETGLGVSIFRDKSTRTRYSFRSACNLLGLATEELDESTSQVAHGETVRETANMISFLTETIGIRDDMYPGEGNRYMREVADAVEDGFKNGVLPDRPAVVNLQCDLDHPTQSLSDLAHLLDRFGGFEGLRGKKLAMTWAYSPSYGKPLSVPQGVVALMTRFGAHVTLAHPEGYELLDEPLEAARRFAAESGGSFRMTKDMGEAFEGADAVYPKSWAPLAVMRQRTKLLRAGEREKLAALEKECLAQNATHKDWEANDDMMRRTRSGKALYMHCLPADVSGVSCKEGEVSASVFERARLDTYREAGYKPYVIASMILATRFADPAGVLLKCLDTAAPRRG
ncbi:MAG: knotted carbamoyltransferase YgeW [Planctomycetota bacterium]